MAAAEMRLHVWQSLRIEMSTTIEPGIESTASSNGAASRSSRLSAQSHRAGFWRDGAPKNITAKDGWKVWSKYLAERRLPKNADSLCRAKGTALAWGINVAKLPQATLDLLQLAAQTNGKQSASNEAIADALSNWVTGTESSPQSVEFALECLAVANLLPSAVTAVEEKTWWAALDFLYETASHSQDWHVEGDADSEVALANQLLVGELPLSLSCLFPEMRPLYKLRAAAQETLGEGLMEFLNGAGLPRAKFLPVFRSLVACWTRCRALSTQANKGFWSSRAEQQYRWAITKAICLSAATGEALLCDSEVAPWAPDFLAGILRIAGKPTDVTAALDLFEKKLTKQIKLRGSKHVPEFSESCEWSGLAMLRTELHRKKAVLGVDYSQPEMRLDLWSGSHRLLSGVWAGETTVAGKRLEVRSHWEETCWFSDPDVDYVELSVDLNDGARLERQILLGRKDKFLLLVDNVMNAPGDQINHCISLPLGPGLHFLPETETREGRLVGKEPVAKILPLGLPEWRIDPRIGELSAVNGALVLIHDRPGSNLSCPLFIDLDPKRLSKACTWRQLTVAESLEIQPHDVAVGYRVQCGKSQWLYYRSQAAAANRTVLGYNLSIEGVVGRFLSPSGEVEELLQIEG
jgi:hypothetical protein